MLFDVIFTLPSEVPPPTGSMGSSGSLVSPESPEVASSPVVFWSVPESVPTPWSSPAVPPAGRLLPVPVPLPDVPSVIVPPSNGMVSQGSGSPNSSKPGSQAVVPVSVVCLWLFARLLRVSSRAKDESVPKKSEYL